MSFPRLIIQTALGIAASLAMPNASPAQDSLPPTPAGACRHAPCRLAVDWGAGATAATYGADRRYGPAADLEPLMRKYLLEHQFRLVDYGSDVMLITLRPTVRNAMCDQLSGTSTDMSCRTIHELVVQFTSPDPSVKSPGSMRISNRCGAGEIKMTIAQVARYSADLIAYNTAEDRKGLKRPTTRC